MFYEEQGRQKVTEKEFNDIAARDTATHIDPSMPKTFVVKAIEDRRALVGAYREAIELLTDSCEVIEALRAGCGEAMLADFRERLAKAYPSVLV